MRELLAACLGAFATYIFTRFQEARDNKRRREAILGALIYDLDRAAKHLERVAVFGSAPESATRAAHDELLRTPYLERLPDFLFYLRPLEVRHLLFADSRISYARARLSRGAAVASEADAAAGKPGFEMAGIIQGTLRNVDHVTEFLAKQLKSGKRWRMGRADPRAVVQAAREPAKSPMAEEETSSV